MQEMTREEYNAWSEAAAVEARAKFEAVGIEIRDDEPDQPHANGCFNCTHHAFDVKGECLDGGLLHYLWGWYTEYNLPIAYIRPVKKD